MPVTRYRSVADMPPPWRDPGDARNLRLVAQLMALHLRLVGRPPAGVRRYRSVVRAEETLEPVAGTHPGAVHR